MIILTFKSSEDEESLIVNVKGHAGAADPGQDLVCGAASMLVYTIAQCVRDMEQAEKLRKKPVISIEEGDAEIVFKPKPEFFTEAFFTLHTIQRGFDLLAHNFPEFISFD